MSELPPLAEMRETITAAVAAQLLGKYGKVEAARNAAEAVLYCFEYRVQREFADQVRQAMSVRETEPQKQTKGATSDNDPLDRWI